jgi:acyl-CoA thioesterase
MGSEFDRGIDLSRTGPGEYAAELDAGWLVGGGINGGYLLGVIANALRASLDGKPDPVAISAHYMGACTPGPAQVTTRVLRNGGSFATAAAELNQDGLTRITALATYGDLARLPDTVETTAVEPEFPPLDECIPNSSAPAEVRRMAPLMARFDMRIPPDSAGALVGSPSGRGRLQAWFRLADGREPDALSVLLALDALPPVTFDLGRPGWAPTLELTAHVRADPAPGWLKISHETRNIAGGMFEEDCEVWDSAGRLVGQSRQLALLPRPATP